MQYFYVFSFWHLYYQRNHNSASTIQLSDHSSFDSFFIPTFLSGDGWTALIILALALISDSIIYSSSTRCVRMKINGACHSLHLYLCMVCPGIRK